MCKTLITSSPSPTLVFSKMISSTKCPIILVKFSTDASEYVVKAYTQDSSSLYSYLREKQVLSSMSHPNIVKPMLESHYQVNIPNHQSIVMEYAPYGDFFNFILENNTNDEKLARTYFRQLIQGIEYLHSNGVAHLDIKLENLLLGKDFVLKIADFELAQNLEENQVLSQGTPNYRAPELRAGNCTDYKAADIYSAGICLFALIARAFPFIEEGDEMKGTLQRYKEFVLKNAKFWKGMEALLRKKVQFSESLRELLNGMWTANPDDRMSLKEIKNSEWYNQSVYSEEELKAVVGDMYRMK